jgi:hypothetical protein
MVMVCLIPAAVACQNPSKAACTAGEEGCGCLELGTCNLGLVCTLDVCESGGGDGDADADGDADTNLDTSAGTDSETATEEDTEADFIYTVPLRERIIQGMYSADPSAHVFDGKLYVYPSHDQDNAPNGNFNMIDYHVYSLAVTNQFVDEGMILSVNDVPWTKQYMWAPDAAYKNGTYYFYFPAKGQDGIFHIGVAEGPSPTGPFTPEPQYIEGSFSIDPAVLVDDDGQAYMYFGGLSGGQLECWKTGSYDASCQGPFGGAALGPRAAKLSDDMKSFSGTPAEVKILDASGNALTAFDETRRFFEGPWVHKYNDKYYLSYSTGTTHLLVYAMADNPMGPYTYKGLLLPDHASGWTTHGSIVEFQGKWYLFYHDSTCSGGQTERRCVKIADLNYNPDGTIQTVQLK